MRKQHLKRNLSKKSAFILMLTFCVQVINASVLSTTAAAMKPGEWKELVTDGFNVNGKNIMDRCVHSLLAFNNSTFWDSTTNQMYILGSGHGVWSTGECAGFLRYNESSNSWTTLEKPPFYSDMNHAWDETAFDPVKREFYHKTSITEETYRYSIQTAQWTKIAPPFDLKEDCRYGALEYFPEMNSLFWYQSAALFNLQTNKWTTLPNAYKMDNLGYNTFAEYNSRLKVMVFGGGGSSTKVYMMNSKGDFFKKAAAPIPLAITKTIQFANSTTGMFIFYDMLSRTLYNYDVFGDKWIKQAGTAPLLSDYGDYQNMVGGYLSTHKVAIFLQWKGVSSKVYLFKPDTTSATPAAIPKSKGNGKLGLIIRAHPTTHSVHIKTPVMQPGYRLSAYDIKGEVLNEWEIGKRELEVEWTQDALSANVLIFRLSQFGNVVESQTVLLN